MPFPKGINTPEVRARFVEERRVIVAEFDRLRASGLRQVQAARQIGRSLSGIEAMRRSVDLLSSGNYHAGRGGKAEEIDLGLALLSCLRKPGETLTSEDIAAWCGCSRSQVQSIEYRALRKVRLRLLAEAQHTDLAEEVEALFGGVAAT